MPKICQITGKKANNAYNISHSNKKTKKIQNVNLQAKKIQHPKTGKRIKMTVSTKALKKLLKT